MHDMSDECLRRPHQDPVSATTRAQACVDSSRLLLALAMDATSGTKLERKRLVQQLRKVAADVGADQCRDDASRQKVREMMGSAICAEGEGTPHSAIRQGEDSGAEHRPLLEEDLPGGAEEEGRCHPRLSGARAPRARSVPCAWR